MYMCPLTYGTRWDLGSDGCALVLSLGDGDEPEGKDHRNGLHFSKMWLTGFAVNE